MATVIRMPEIAAGTDAAALATWLVAVGDEIAVGQPIAEIETEKAVVEYEAEAAGVLAGVLLAEGAAAEVGTPIAVLAGAGEDPAVALAAAGAGSPVGSEAAPTASQSLSATTVPAPAVAEPAAPEPAAVTGYAEDTVDRTSTEPARGEPLARPPAGRRFMSPLVRRLARDRGIDLSTVNGSGPNGRIVRRDIDALAAARIAPSPPRPAAAPTAPPQPAPTSRAQPARTEPAPARSVPTGLAPPQTSEPAPAQPAPPLPEPAPTSPGLPVSASPPLAGAAGYTDVPHTAMRQAIARRLTDSKTTVPHFYLRADCRVDALLALRSRIAEETGVKVSVNDLVVKAVAKALADVPEANAIWTGQARRRFACVDIAVAVSVPDGLLTPVVRGAERLSLGELSATIRELAGRAREGRLRQHELEGGSFAVSNLGMYGTAEFAAIINPPHAGILAVGAATRQPVVLDSATGDDGTLGVATLMTVTLSADHRVLDGALAAQWLSAFAARIENPLALLL